VVLLRSLLERDPGLSKIHRASKVIGGWWEAQQFPTLKLEETDPVRLSPYAYKRGDETKRQKAASLSALDFRVSEHGRPLFHIEQKTGPGSIDDMTEFQLDLNDLNDIVGVVNGTGLPAYIIHVQAGRSIPSRLAAPLSMACGGPISSGY
jgi:hypothetical protein